MELRTRLDDTGLGSQLLKTHLPRWLGVLIIVSQTSLLTLKFLDHMMTVVLEELLHHIRRDNPRLPYRQILHNFLLRHFSRPYHFIRSKHHTQQDSTQEQVGANRNSKQDEHHLYSL